MSDAGNISDIRNNHSTASEMSSGNIERIGKILKNARLLSTEVENCAKNEDSGAIRILKIVDRSQGADNQKRIGNDPTKEDH